MTVPRLNVRRHPVTLMLVITVMLPAAVVYFSRGGVII